MLHDAGYRMSIGDMTMARKNPARELSEAESRGTAEGKDAMQEKNQCILPHEDERGWTLVEVLFMGVIIVILMTIGITMFQNQGEKTKLVKCMAEIRGIQAAVISM